MINAEPAFNVATFGLMLNFVGVYFMSKQDTIGVWCLCFGHLSYLVALLMKGL